MKPRLALLAVLATFLASASARAQTCTASTSGLAFGTYSGPSGAASDTAGSVSVRCQGTIAIAIPFTVGLTAGSGGSIAARTLVSVANRLNYQIYTNAARTQVWGDGTGGTTQVSGSIVLTLGNLSLLNTISVYGRIAARQNVPAGSYTDAVQVVVTY